MLQAHDLAETLVNDYAFCFVITSKFLFRRVDRQSPYIARILYFLPSRIYEVRGKERNLVTSCVFGQVACDF